MKKNIKLLSACIICMAAVSVFAKEPAKSPVAVISIETDPVGATVVIDRKTDAISPADINLAPGQHLVKITQDGYDTEYKTVDLADGEKLSLNFKLNKTTGLLIAGSQPPGAEVKIGEVTYGTSPVLITTLPLGVYHVSYSLGGYVSKTVEVNLKDRTPVKLDTPLTSSTALLRVKCNVEAATVYIDGVQRGETPCDIDRINAGDIEFKIEANGYKPYTQKIKLAEGQEEELVINLEIQPGKLNIVSMPDKARVYVDNSFLGNSPAMIETLAPGEHRVRVECEGFDPLARNVTIEAGESKVEEFRLTANTGRVLLTTTPDGVTVILNGKEHGKTSPAGNGAQISAEYALEALAEGEHTLKFVAPGYFETERTVMVKRGNTESISVDLKRRFIPDYQVVDGAGVHTGVLKSKNAESIRLEVKKGMTQTFLLKDIKEHGPIAVAKP